MDESRHGGSDELVDIIPQEISSTLVVLKESPSLIQEEKGFCLYNQDGSVQRVVEDVKEMQTIFAKVLQAWERKQNEMYCVEDAGPESPSAPATETYEIPLEYQEPSKKKRNHSAISSNSAKPPPSNNKSTAIGSRRSSRRHGALGKKEELFSLTYSYGSMGKTLKCIFGNSMFILFLMPLALFLSFFLSFFAEWDAIKKCWRPRKPNPPSKRSSKKQKKSSEETRFAPTEINKESTPNQSALLV
jgi:hypothetical protein